MRCTGEPRKKQGSTRRNGQKTVLAAVVEAGGRKCNSRYGEKVLIGSEDRPVYVLPAHFTRFPKFLGVGCLVTNGRQDGKTPLAKSLRNRSRVIRGWFHGLKEIPHFHHRLVRVRSLHRVDASHMSLYLRSLVYMGTSQG